MYVLVLTHIVHPIRDASKPTRNGIVHPLRRTQKPTEGTGSHPPYLWRKPMAQVTYRGVEYDTEEYREMLIKEHNQTRNHDLMYRGIKVRSKAIPCS